MKRQMIIAKCLLNSGMIGSGNLEDAEFAVLRHFQIEFPGKDFNLWNQDVNDKGAEQIITNVGRASSINVRRFIENLES